MTRSSLGPTVGAAVAVALTLSACEDETPRSTLVTASDSSGVRVVESGRPESPSLMVVPEPLFRLGWRSDGPQFQDVSSGFVRLDGGALVADAGANVMFAFEADGAAIGTIGRSGQGPGEFTSMGSAVPLPSDSFLVMDDGNNRVSFYRDLEYVGDARFESFYSPALYAPFAHRADGAYWIGPMAWAPSLVAQEEPGWVDAPLLVTSDFARVDTVRLFPLVYHLTDANPIRPVAQFVASGQRIAFLSSAAAQVTWLDEDGLPEQIARWDSPSAQLTDTDWADYEAGVRARNTNFDPTRLERILAERRRDWGGPEPIFRAAIGDRVGGVWLTPYDVAEGGVSALFVDRYEVIEPDGAHAGSVSFPSPIRLLDVTEDRVLGVERDELDVQAVVMYRLVRHGRE